MFDDAPQSDAFADFRSVIDNAFKRGLSIHPVKPRGKEPWLNNWPKHATNSRACIEGWNVRFPTSNYGVAANEEFCILESDDINALTSRLSRALPVTYTVQARENRPHIYFRQTEASKAAGNMDSPGVFEFKQNNRYVVGEGSIHPTGAVYKCISDEPIVPIPDWLVSDLQAIREGRDIAVSAPLPDDGRKLGEGEGRHPMLMRQAAVLWDGSKTREEMFDELEQINQQHCDPPKTSAHLLDIIDWVMAREPNSRGPKVVMGAPWGTKATALYERSIPQRATLMVQVNEDGTEEELFYESSINQILAWRGVGKTLFSLRLAGCFATGGTVLSYRALEPRRVLYVDGELPISQLRERAGSMCLSDNVFLVNPEDITPAEPINLFSDSHWTKLIQAIEAHKIDVLFLDSLSTVTRMRTNEDDDQIEWQTKMNILRNRYHLCVIVLHHVGKSGQQRGLSKNDDNLDIQMHLKKCEGWEPGEGLKFEMAFEKVRSGARLVGGFQVTLENGEFKRGVPDVEVAVGELLKENKSVRAIADELDVTKSKVQRIKRKIESSTRKDFNLKHNQGEK